MKILTSISFFRVAYMPIAVSYNLLCIFILLSTQKQCIGVLIWRWRTHMSHAFNEECIPLDDTIFIQLFISYSLKSTPTFYVGLVNKTQWTIQPKVFFRVQALSIYQNSFCKLHQAYLQEPSKKRKRKRHLQSQPTLSKRAMWDCI